MHELLFAASTMGWRDVVLWCRTNMAALLGGPGRVDAPLAPATPASRDIRLDLFRGLALWFIFLDHIPGNVASWITVRNYGFSDATEIFVFISGYTAALVYGKAMREHGLVPSAAHILKRVWQIYVAHVFLFVIYAAVIAYVAAGTGNGLYIDKLGLAEFFRQPDFMFIQVLLLRFKPANMDVLPMYMAVMIAFPPLLWLLVRRPDRALAASLAIYAIARSNGWNFVSHSGGAWPFNPFAWQLMFVFGAWCALGGATRLAGLIRSRIVSAAAALYLAFAFAITMTWHVPALAEFVPAWLAALIYPIDKANLDVLRILHFLALAALTVRLVRPDTGIIARPLLRPVVRCGMHSLEIFSLSVLLSFLSYAAVIETAAGAAMQIVVSAAGVSLLIAAATLIAWCRGIDDERRPSRSTAMHAVPVRVVAPA